MITEKKRNKTVLVGISGGVDSTVSCYLLKKKGFLVKAVFLNFFDNNQKILEAERVAKKVGVDFYVIDVKREFQKKVVDYFVNDLRKGRTPNPCVVCNREIKFNFLIKRMNDLGADFLATGHYVRIIKEGERVKVLKGKDKGKDQSYFLWRLKKEWLKRLIFPLGDFIKKEVKQIALENNLFDANKKESQEVCFADDVNDFLKEKIGTLEGDVVDRKRGVIGKHSGLCYYTIGQRKGLNLAGGPYYVLEKDVKNNIIIVTKNNDDLFSKDLYYGGANFFTDVSFPFSASIKVRYRGELIDGVVDEEQVVFKKPQKAVAPGQSIVFYKGEELLGGGVIK